MRYESLINKTFKPLCNAKGLLEIQEYASSPFQRYLQLASISSQSLKFETEVCPIIWICIIKQRSADYKYVIFNYKNVSNILDSCMPK